MSPTHSLLTTANQRGSVQIFWKIGRQLIFIWAFRKTTREFPTGSLSFGRDRPRVATGILDRSDRRHKFEFKLLWSIELELLFGWFFPRAKALDLDFFALCKVLILWVRLLYLCDFLFFGLPSLWIFRYQTGPEYQTWYNLIKLASFVYH